MTENNEEITQKISNQIAIDSSRLSIPSLGIGSFEFQLRKENANGTLIIRIYGLTSETYDKSDRFIILDGKRYKTSHANTSGGGSYIDGVEKDVEIIAKPVI